MDFILALLSRILGDDNALVTALTDAEAASLDDLNLGEAFTDDEKAAIAAFANVSDDQLTEIRTAIRENSDDLTAAELTELAGYAKGLAWLQDVRAADAAEVERLRAEVAESLAEPADPALAEIEGLTLEDIEALNADKPEEEEAPSEAPAEEPEPVVASARPPLGAVQSRMPASRTPAPVEPNEPTLTIVASGGSANGTPVMAGESIPESAFPDWFADMSSNFLGADNLPKTRLARRTTSYPEDRTLTGIPDHDAMVVASAVSEMLEAGQDAGRGLQTLTASGGLCAPRQPYYPLAQIADSGRPVTDFLPKLGAPRGGITFVTPPTYPGVSTGYGIWTAANDANPSNPSTKVPVSVTCGTPTTVDIAAVWQALEVGNMGNMTYPERTAVWQELLSAHHSAVAEAAIITYIDSNSTPCSDGANLGTSRDILDGVRRAAMTYRNRNRMAPDATLDVLLPAWIIDTMLADQTRQVPGDGAYARTRQNIIDDLQSVGVRAGFFRDSQTYGAQVGTGALLPWKTTCTWYLFHPGAFLFLDGGMLDLGVVRDSTLNSTNDLEIWSETFEATAYVGVESLKVVSTICTNGTTSAPLDIHTICAS